jgi:hypothetical protein
MHFILNVRRVRTIYRFRNIANDSELNGQVDKARMLLAGVIAEESVARQTFEAESKQNFGDHRKTGHDGDDDAAAQVSAGGISAGLDQSET